MFEWIAVAVGWLVALLRTRLDLAAENLALRHQLNVLRRKIKRPPIRDGDRLFWALLSEVWRRWREALCIVSPATVVKWHRRAFKAFWAWKSSHQGPGRPPVPPEIRQLVREMALANPTWGAPRIHGELLKLGIVVSQRTVSNLMPKRKKPPSQTWSTFLENHVGSLVCCDFFTVPTIMFDVLYVFLILDLERRTIVSFGVTRHPTAEWTANIFVEAFPWDTAPRYLLRDRDSIYGNVFRNRVKNMGVKEVLTAPRSPWQNPFVERVIGSIRRECLDHLIVFNEKHLRHILRQYVDYYHEDRTHLALAKDTPCKRPVLERPVGEAILVEEPRLGGLHHRYSWQKAA